METFSLRLTSESNSNTILLKEKKSKRKVRKQIVRNQHDREEHLSDVQVGKIFLLCSPSKADVLP